MPAACYISLHVQILLLAACTLSSASPRLLMSGLEPLTCRLRIVRTGGTGGNPNHLLALKHQISANVTSFVSYGTLFGTLIKLRKKKDRQSISAVGRWFALERILVTAAQ